MSSACRAILCAVAVAMTPASSGFAQGAINEMQQSPFSPPATVMSMPDDAAGGPGSDAYVTISAAPGNGSAGIFGIDMTLTYDKDVLEFVSAEVFGDAITLPSPPPVCSGSNFGLAYVNNAATGTLTISEFSQCDALQVIYPNIGVIARVRFQVLGSYGATSALNFTAVTINEGAIDATFDNGTFTVNCVGAANGTACDDGTVCNGHETCQSNVCTSGAALDCDDHNACTTDSCAPIAGCQHGSEPTSTPCGTTGQCENQDFCNGTGSCTDNGFKSAATHCTGASQLAECDDNAADHCTGTSNACVDVFRSAAAICGNQTTNTECDRPDHCSGTSAACDPNYQSTSTTCGTTGQCENQDFCNGTGSCTDNGFKSAATHCTGASEVAECDDNAADHCTGTSNACVDAFRSAAAICGNQTTNTECDRPDHCSGTSAACDPNYSSTSTACGTPGQCENQDFCSGAGLCTDNGFKSAATTCTGASQSAECDDNAADHCTGTSNACVDAFRSAAATCGNQTTNTECDRPDHCSGTSVACDPNYQSTSTTCGTTGQCENQDFCNGTGSCTDNGFKSAATHCTGASEVAECDDNAADHCTGTSNACVDAFRSAAAICGNQTTNTECDRPDHCSGTSAACDPSYQSTSTACGTTGQCENQDFCNGTGSCTDNGFKSAATHCTGASQLAECDDNAADHCTGTSNACVDAFRSAAAICGNQTTNTECDRPDHCSGTSAACDPNYQSTSTACGTTGQCENQDFCSGAGSCTDNGFKSAATHCTGASEVAECDDNAADHCTGTSNACVDAFRSAAAICGNQTTNTECDRPDHCSGTSAACDPNYQSTSTACGTTGQCENQDFCNGAGSCTDNGFKSAATHCTGASQSAECDDNATDHCSGTSNACVDVFRSVAAICGNQTTDTVCDRPDHCSGTSAACDPNYQSTSTACGDVDGPCTNPDSCDGLGVCHDNGYKAQGTPCRASAGACDAGASCDGTGPVCPPNVYTCSVNGTVVYYRDDAGTGSEPSAKPVSNVPVNLGGFGNGSTTSNASGAYSFGGLFGNVTITSGALWGGARATTHSGVISSLDASAIARTAVHMITLTANQTIAGDVTGDQTISAFDASYVARYAALLVDHFPVSIASGSDWSFLPVSYSYSPIGASQAGKDFSAILYGDVTGNWSGPAPLQGFASSSRNGGSPEAVAADEALIDLGRQLTPAQLEPARTSQPVELTMSGGTTPLRAGEEQQVVISLQNADAILGLDLSLTYDPSRIAIVEAQATGIGSGFNVAQSSRQGTCRIAAYGIAPLSGSGSVMIVTVKALQTMGRGAPLTISAVANEGTIPVVVRGGNGRLLPRLVERKSGFVD